MEPKYSINELESLVREGKFKKKIIKSTYTREFLSRAYETMRVGIISGGIIGGICGIIGLSLVGMKKSCLIIGEESLRCGEIFSYGDARGMTLIGLLGFGAFGAMMSSMPIFYEWRDRAKPYVQAGGKIIYEEKGFKFNKERFVLPLNYPTDNSKEIDWNTPFVLSPADMNRVLK